MKAAPYKLSFTAAGLSVNGSLRMAEAYVQLGDWAAVKSQVFAENLLQARTRSSLQRTVAELTPRLQHLTDEQLRLLAEGTPQEQRCLLWFAVCQHYDFIREFAVEVVREKLLHLDFELSPLDYDAFFYKKADWHEELDRLKETTRKKIRTVLFRMLREAGLVSPAQMIIPTMLSPRLVEVLAPNAPVSYQIFPIPLADMPLE